VAKGWAPGVVGEINGRKRQLTGKPYNAKQLKPPAQHINTSDYTANFEDFFNDKPEGTPFCFWYGCTEPHRAYEYKAGIDKAGKQLKDIEHIPSFWPQNDTVKTDLLDYAFEIEWFDQHLQKMLSFLEEQGELENTLVVVTADHGMPFPRVKGQAYEYSNHVPFAVMWQKGITHPGRVVDDFVNFIDIAPTFLEVAGLNGETQGMQSITGRSLTELFRSSREGRINKTRDHVLIGKERHDIGRPRDWGYPIRGIIKEGYLYIHNFETDRWPGGNPQTGYLNCDGSPTKTKVLESRKDATTRTYWELSFGKRNVEELYHIESDRECINNLADDPQYSELKTGLKEQLFNELKEQGDPRMFGDGHVFDEYLYADEKHRHFYEKYKRGENLRAGWVNESDFEPDFPD